MNENIKLYSKIRSHLNNLGLAYITTQCIDVDIQCIGDNDFKSIDEVLHFYKNANETLIETIYLEYYGIEELID